MACCHLLTPHTLEVPLMLVPIWGKISSSGACWLAAKKKCRSKKCREQKKIDSRKNNTGPYYDTSGIYVKISYHDFI